MDKNTGENPAVDVENRIYLALGDLYNLDTIDTIDIAGRVSLQMTAIVSDTLTQNGLKENRLAALRYIEDALADLAALRAQVKGPHPAQS